MHPITLLHLRLDDPPLPVTTLATFLSPDEVVRAERFVFATHRHRFVTVRGWLRWKLGQATGRAPETLRFDYGPHGKPYLPNALDLQFNLAHSGERALLGLAQGRPIGVDIEQMRPLPDLASIVRNFFSPQEQAEIFGQPPTRREEVFFTIWTCKEAYLKALGDGLARPLHSFTVAIPPDLAIRRAADPRLLAVANDPTEVERWQFAAVAVESGYQAAVCYGR